MSNPPVEIPMGGVMIFTLETDTGNKMAFPAWLPDSPHERNGLLIDFRNYERTGLIDGIPEPWRSCALQSEPVGFVFKVENAIYPCVVGKENTNDCL